MSGDMLTEDGDLVPPLYACATGDVPRDTCGVVHCGRDQTTAAITALQAVTENEHEDGPVYPTTVSTGPQATTEDVHHAIPVVRCRESAKADVAMSGATLVAGRA